MALVKPGDPQSPFAGRLLILGTGLDTPKIPLQVTHSFGGAVFWLPQQYPTTCGKIRCDRMPAKARADEDSIASV